ncbi:hypothetical protein PV332_10725 [Streptomyces scabiei]|uniref:hypothetical protein n=1 Tax=Streptomyces scabiei TaxID=1930 RepID=UPI0029A1C211|nr:hypothetical protein [Streptomyces scabiei]MDX2575953.1 hypothetical protein [Streptomyces scabiei]MDX2885574.1 hypothetical protein [Streptomyces scabiei]MDX2993473.1 hypothetical protein [Streptomyces scabiei]MDX3028412.1 hypothetical protein [Streptomyces scabiei]MDX3047253.1 hypothetical protein [Streptomyces scabiei]
MKQEISRTVDDMVFVGDVSVFTREEGMHEYYKPGIVYQGHPYDGEYPEFGYTPEQARELAAALSRAADEAEEKPSNACRILSP